MYLRKYISLLLGVFILVITSVSCRKGVLDLTDPNNIAEDDFWVTERDAMMGLAGIFDAYQEQHLMGSFYREFDHITDNATTVQDTKRWLQFETDAQNPSVDLVSRFWVRYYTIISRANRVIDRVAKMPEAALQESARKRIIAEAKFLRAYAYYDLTAIWGNVPFYTTSNEAFTTPKAATEKPEIYAGIITELRDEVIAALPETISTGELGRISKGAARALLGKFYLTDKQYSQAATILKEVIDSKLYTLYPDFGKLFSVEGEFSSESLFEINFSNRTLDAGENFSVRIDTNLAPTQPSGHWAPIPNLVNSFLCKDGKPISDNALYGTKSSLYIAATPYLNRDPRLRASIFTSADVTSAGKKIWSWANNNSFAVKKYATFTAEQFPDGGPQNYYVIRYADVLLMYAEAQNEAMGPDATVQAAINMVRRRVAMPDVPATLSQTSMRQYIRDERRWEFAFEHQRFFDLKRWGILGPVTAAALTKKKYSEPRINNWPYPLAEMDRNKALKAQGQNAGY